MANAIHIQHHSLCVLVAGNGARAVHGMPRDRSTGRLMSVLRLCGNAIRRQLSNRWMANQPEGNVRVILASAHLAAPQAALLRPGPIAGRRCQDWPAER